MTTLQYTPLCRKEKVQEEEAILLQSGTLILSIKVLFFFFFSLFCFLICVLILDECHVLCVHKAYIRTITSYCMLLFMKKSNLSCCFAWCYLLPLAEKRHNNKGQCFFFKSMLIINCDYARLGYNRPVSR